MPSLTAGAKNHRNSLLHKELHKIDQMVQTAKNIGSVLFFIHSLLFML